MEGVACCHYTNAHMVARHDRYDPCVCLTGDLSRRRPVGTPMVSIFGGAKPSNAALVPRPEVGPATPGLGNRRSIR